MSAVAWGIIIGVLVTHVAYAIVFALIWWRVISREPQPLAPPSTTVDHVIVREIGTLTYSRRN